MKFLLLLIAFLCPLLSVSALAANDSSIQTVLAAVKTFVYDETRHLPGRVTIKPGRPNSDPALRSCRQPEPFLPPGGRLWGKFSVGVRCQDEATWTFYIPVEIEVIASVVHAARPVSMGSMLNAGDIVIKEVDLVRTPGNAVTDPDQVIGKVAASYLASGQSIRTHQLRAPHVISRGQKVRLVVTGTGFTVSTEGDALAAAAEGEVVQVRNHTGRIISGIAREGGIVEVRQ